MKPKCLVAKRKTRALRQRTSVEDRVNVAGAKARLSHYLALAKKGHEIVITEHKNPIAKIVPFLEAQDGFQVIEASEAPGLILELALAGSVVRDWDSVSLLLEDRREE